MKAHTRRRNNFDVGAHRRISKYFDGDAHEKKEPFFDVGAHKYMQKLMQVHTKNSNHVDQHVPEKKQPKLI